MRGRRLLAGATVLAAATGFTVSGASPAFAAGCYVNHMALIAATTGYVNSAYIIGPYAFAESMSCSALSVTITVTPATVGGIPRVATPGGCTYPEPGVPVLGPNEAYCGPTGGYGSVALAATSYPYVTLTGVAVGVGADGTYNTWTRSCVVRVAELGGSSCPGADR